MSDRLASIVYAVLAVALLVLLALQAKPATEGRRPIGSAFRETTGHAWGGVLGITEALRHISDNYRTMISGRAEREKMQEQLGLLQAEHQRTYEIWQENLRLRELLDLREANEFPRGVVGRVFADLSSGPLHRAVSVDRGYTHGVSEGWIVLSRGALVGRLRNVQRNRSEVQLIVDPESGVGVRHELDRFAGILRGGNRNPSVFARLEYVPRDMPVAVGDTVVTSGLDGIFPPGLLVGYVRDMSGESPLAWRILVEVAADMTNLEEVLLVPPYNKPRTPRTIAPPVTPVVPIEGASGSGGGR